MASPPGTVLTIGVDVPLPSAQSAADAVELAVADANAAGVGSWVIRVEVADDTLPATGFADPQQGAANAAQFVANDSAVAMIGPYNSTVARAVIPITNAAGLLQCGFATTAPDLTELPAALQLRPTAPNLVSFVRVSAPDDLQGPAAARFAVGSLHATRAVVIDDGMSFGQGVAASFAAAFSRAGGTVVGRGSPSGPAALARLLATARTGHPNVAYFGGASVTGGGSVRAAMAAAGLGGVPFIGPDGIVDSTFLQDAGAAAAGSYATINTISRFPGSDQFAARLKSAYGLEPGPYDAGAYVCAEIVVDALRQVAPGDLRTVRQAVRTYVTTPGRALPTFIGPQSFDQNGDTTAPVISIFKVTAGTAIGQAAWSFDDQVTMGPP